MDRKIILIISLVLLLTTKANTQIIENYGIKLGYVNSGQTFSNELLNDGLKRKSGISVSAFVELFNFSGFIVSPEVKYIQKGTGMEFYITNSEGPQPIGKTTKYFYHNYLSIPISFEYKKQFIVGSSFIKVAPRYDILLKSYDDLDIPASDYDEYKNVFGGTISLGFIPNLNIGFSPFLELSYHMDFTNTYSGDFNKIKNNAIEVSLGLYM